MKRFFTWIPVIALLAISCGSPSVKKGERIITVTLPPFAWFVEGIAGDDFIVNVMLPPGADHHIWEPLPAQITSLAGSEAFIFNGQLGFEHAWMGRFTEINDEMKMLDLSAGIELIGEEEDGHNEDHLDHEGHNHEGADPHYWMSPVSAYVMAENIRNFLTELNPGSAEKYVTGYENLVKKIDMVDSILKAAMLETPSKAFMIYHPALGYMAKDYGLQQVTFEDEGKSPSPARMKELIDTARELDIRIIFIQAEYDIRSARSLAEETNTETIVIDPMNRDWEKAVIEVAEALEAGGR
ncbi:MAG: zinc ABC transporter substrate-binding protein [Bacteroidales bacterium]|nr:zinc ABC transporter substrate-binding protein [Bacteroidales bacterium]